MARGVNKVILVGNVGNDPEIRATSSGSRVAKISLATNHSWQDRTGQRQEKTEWHRLTVFGKLVDVVEQWVKKGDRLYVEGPISYSQTDGPDGPKYWTDIVVGELVMLGSPGGSGVNQDGPRGGGRPAPPRNDPAPAGYADPDDDLSF